MKDPLDGDALRLEIFDSRVTEGQQRSDDNDRRLRTIDSRLCGFHRRAGADRIIDNRDALAAYRRKEGARQMIGCPEQARGCGLLTSDGVIETGAQPHCDRLRKESAAEK